LNGTFESEIRTFVTISITDRDAETLVKSSGHPSPSLRLKVNIHEDASIPKSSCENIASVE